MARNKSSQFGAADGLFSVGSVNDVQETHVKPEIYEEQEVQEVHDAHEVQKAYEAHGVQDARIETKKTLGSTQGRKGEKLKRINLAFDDENYAYVRLESRRRGRNITEFVNSIIEEYRLSDKGKISDSEIR